MREPTTIEPSSPTGSLQALGSGAQRPPEIDLSSDEEEAHATTPLLGGDAAAAPMKPERAAGWADADLMQRAEGLDELDRNDKRRERKKRIADTAHALREKRPMLLRNTRRRGWIKSGLQNLGAEHGF